MNKCPKFCDYLFKESQSKNLTIKNFISKKFPSRDRSWQTFEEKFSESLRKDDPELQSTADISKEEAIWDTDFSTICDAAKWLIEEKKLIETYEERAAEYNKLQEIKVLAKIPNLEQLDILMHYQTSLQRQLSTAMGELLAITS